MNSEMVGVKFAMIKNVNPEVENEKKTLKRGLIKDDFYECEYCYKTLTKQNYSHHLKRCSIYKKKKENDKKDVILYADNNNKKLSTYTKHIKLDPEGNKQIDIIPSGKSRDCILIIGISGSGKSYFLNEYMKKWVNDHKNKDIYFFSSLKEDPSITVKVDRVDLEKFYNEDELYLEDFKDCLLVFDDCEMISNTKIRKKLYNFINYLLMTGRHTNTYIIITLHNPCTRSSDTKIMLNESSVIVTFLAGIGNRGIDYLFSSYLGLSNKQIKRLRLMSDHSRWVSVIKHSIPYIICSQYEAFVNLASNDLE